MQIQLIRNATLRIDYAGRRFVIDPFLAPKHTMESFAGESLNPVVDLPCTPQEAVEGVEMVVVSHLHPDHIDQIAVELLPKEIPVYCQPGDEVAFKRAGFGSVTPVESSTKWDGITITRTPGRHGTGFMAEQMGRVSGFIFEAEGEPRVYWAGDTVWYDGVARVLKHMEPDIVITHSGGAKFPGSGPIIMDAEQTLSVCEAAPKATVIATHMESLDHLTVSRADLRALAEQNGIAANRLLIPADGEMLSL